MTVWSDDYGMCCDEAQARVCVREYNQRKRAEEEKGTAFLKGIVIGVVAVLLCAGICWGCYMLSV